MTSLVIIVCKAVPSFFSFLGSLLMIIIYNSYSELKHGISFKLIELIAVTELIKSLIGLINWFNSPHYLCMVMGGGDYYSAYSSMICLGVISWAIFVNAEGIEESYIQKKLVWIVLLEFVIIPLPLSALPTIWDLYGYDENSFCTIKFNSNNMTAGIILRFIYYLFALGILSYSMICYYFTIKYMKESQLKCGVTKLAIRMRGYLIVLCLCTLFPLIERILELFSWNYLILEGIAVFGYHSTGYLTAFVFGYNKSVQELVRLSFKNRGLCGCCFDSERVASSIYSEVGLNYSLNQTIIDNN